MSQVQAVVPHFFMQCPFEGTLHLTNNIITWKWKNPGTLHANGQGFGSVYLASITDYLQSFWIFSSHVIECLSNLCQKKQNKIHDYSENWEKKTTDMVSITTIIIWNFSSLKVLCYSVNRALAQVALSVCKMSQLKFASIVRSRSSIEEVNEGKTKM